MRVQFFAPIILVIVLASCAGNKSATTSNNLSTNKAKPSSPNKKASEVIQAARQYLGTPYKYSGTDRNGIDCSGLMCRAFSSIGMQLPHQSAEQSNMGTAVGIKDLRPGDLVFLGASKGSKKVTHVGLVVSVSADKIIFIHASTKKGVIEENLLAAWYQPLFIKGARLF